MARNLATGLVALALSAGAVQAHPHVFVDTALRLEFDEGGRLTGIRVTWVYDAFYSLVILQDRGLDPDYDGRLTADERARLAGFDLNWSGSFDGALHPALGAADLALGPPEAAAADVLGGRIVSTHLRPLPSPVDPGGKTLRVAVYDPGFYAAYALIGPTEFRGRDDCAAQVALPDLDEADRAFQAELAAIGPEVSIEDDFPEVGHLFAEAAVIACAGR